MKDSTIKTLVLLGIVASVGAILYYVFKGKKALGDANAAVLGSGGSAGGGAGGSPQNSAGCANCPSFTSVDSVARDLPGANFRKCGSAVAALQQEINTLRPGSNLVVDGCYGLKTQTAHQSLLDTNNGWWPVQ
jgi:hypothetical protein